MARAAGNTETYEWVLRNKRTGEYDKTDTIELISVTSVIGKVLGKPQLMPWQFYKTLELIAGAVRQLNQLDADGNPLVESADLWDTFTDYDMLKEWLRDSRMRPEDVVDDAATRGSEYHTYLESLAGAYLDERVGPVWAQQLAQWLVDTYDDNRRAIGQWWLDNSPQVVASEQRVRSLSHGYAGTLDLAYLGRGGVILLDLKNRGDDKQVYDSDRMQLQAYEIAYEEQYRERVAETRVLVARDNGTYHEEKVVLRDGAWLSLLDTYRALYPDGPKKKSLKRILR